MCTNFFFCTRPCGERATPFSHEVGFLLTRFQLAGFMDPQVILKLVIDNFWGPLTYYHWLIGTIIIAYCSVGIFYQPRNKNSYVFPYQFVGVLFRYFNLVYIHRLRRFLQSNLFFSVAAFMFVANGFQTQPEIYPVLGASLVLGIDH